MELSAFAKKRRLELSAFAVKQTFNPLRIQRTAGGTPSGDRVKSPDTKTQQKKKVERHISMES